MKIPFFIILFIILVFSLLFISYYGFFGKGVCSKQEGFVSFAFDKSPLVGDIIVPTYSPSSRIFKLYDNLFFDNTNGNLIQANGQSSQQGNTNADSTNVNLTDSAGTSLSSVIVYNRDSSVGSVTINTQLTNGSVTNTASHQSQKSGYDVSFSQFMISNLNGNTTDNYQTLYVAWGKNTFIDVINTSVAPPQTLLGALFSDSQLQGHLVPVPYISQDANLIKIVATQFVSDPSDGRLNTQPWYGNNSLYQVCSFLHYDTANGNIVLKNNQEAGTSLVRVLDRQFSSVSINGGVSKTLPSVGYVVHSVQFDPSDSSENPDSPKFFIYYVGFGQNTLLIVLKKQVQTNDMFKIVKVARFSKDGYVDPTSSNTVSPSDGSGDSKVTKDLVASDMDLLNNDMDLYGIDVLLANQIDYIQKNYVKKSDMVAPIYPTVLSCPSCSGGNGGVCGNCGGNGGSGTVGASGTSGGNTVAGGVNNAVNGIVGVGNNVVGGAVDLGKTTLDLGKQAVSGTVDLGKETVGGVVDLTKQGATGIANIADKTVSGAVDLTKQGVSGAVDLGKETVGGAVDLTKQGVSGAVSELNYLTSTPGRNSGSGYGGQGGGYGGQSAGYGGAYPSGQQGVPIKYNTAGTVPGVDPTSGYGSMVSKGDNFMPLTASFSAFGK